MVLKLRAGSGLGDSLYLQSAARYFVEKGHEVEVHSNWPDVFRPLNVTVTPFSRLDVDRIVHYTHGKQNKRTTQWEDCLARAEIREKVDLRLDWKPINTALIERLKVWRKPIVAVSLPRQPMDRKDGFGSELLPEQGALQRALDLIGNSAAKVLVGKGDAKYQLSGIDLDLSNATSLTDLIDIVSAADFVLGYVSFFVPLAESLGKPGLMVWSRKGLNSDIEYIRTITPQKIIHRKDLLSAVMDDATEQETRNAVDALLEKIGAAPGF